MYALGRSVQSVNNLLFNYILHDCTHFMLRLELEAHTKVNTLTESDTLRIKNAIE